MALDQSPRPASGVIPGKQGNEVKRASRAC